MHQGKAAQSPPSLTHCLGWRKGMADELPALHVSLQGSAQLSSLRNPEAPFGR